VNITIVGVGRAGTSFASALGYVGHRVQLVHHDDITLLDAPELIVLCVPDDAISAVAAQIPVSDQYAVAHVAGSRSLNVLGEHRRVASMHPLMALPSGQRGAERLIGATYCVAGDEVILDVVASLDGRVITMRDDQRTAYHAAAVVASNHLVALMGQVEHLAQMVGLELENFLPLAFQSLRDVADVGPARALTGPASRGDMSTIDAHLAAIPESERSAYVAMANAAFELAERQRSQLRA
jgi:predicted short-subunit dehydrogenase-like oxidoreductase (DUF2520 family)